jgi:hypothetical protein
VDQEVGGSSPPSSVPDNILNKLVYPFKPERSCLVGCFVEPRGNHLNLNIDLASHRGAVAS